MQVLVILLWIAGTRVPRDYGQAHIYTRIDPREAPLLKKRVRYEAVPLSSRTYRSITQEDEQIPLVAGRTFSLL